jgi:hypothetical protein
MTPAARLAAAAAAFALLCLAYLVQPFTGSFLLVAAVAALVAAGLYAVLPREPPAQEGA